MWDETRLFLGNAENNLQEALGHGFEIHDPGRTGLAHLRLILPDKVRGCHIDNVCCIHLFERGPVNAPGKHLWSSVDAAEREILVENGLPFGVEPAFGAVTLNTRLDASAAMVLAKKERFDICEKNRRHTLQSSGNY